MVEVHAKSKMGLNGSSGSGTQPINRRKNLSQQIWDVVQLIGDVVLLWVLVLYSLGERFYRYIVPVPERPVKGEIVLITGTGHGMGKELALLYASKGATVVGWDVNTKSNEETISEINARGYPKAYAYYCDVSNKDSVFEVAKKVLKEVGDVSILINNAGIMPTHPILDQTKEEIEKTFAINVFAHFWTIQAFLPTMKKNNHGHIVALSSCAGLFGLENLVPYCGTKFAVRGIMEALHEEFRQEKNCKIETTCVCPYMVDTGLCKKPKVRFERLMPLLNPRYAAKSIMKAQQTQQKLVSIPGYLVNLNDFVRVLPLKAGLYIKDFINSGVESDL
ncbi:epidermal retinol dehydrogenase 2 [Tribolium castaneum]|uniref:Short-chain dehydrogenase/reductase 3 n=2 Tax=Tribolium castaneum TaxID=7070 RepID=A0A139WPL1_TRICA|nr:PREDICTED: epidermal retinol dehydrogenase 2 [Tribolium castaneum]KYB29771.1 Peroxisomal multifunctional enzyme type 2-like Protein [Tribolium castaneum]|eukprot:XP_008199406.1 PREDICTED: epidermal retinol dehydrogenase 2 [Tribolium castaneum]